MRGPKLAATSVVLVGLLTLLVAACQSGGNVVVVSEFQFDPAEVSAVPGTSLLIENDGSMQHDFTIRQLNITSGKVQAGQTGELMVPGPGTYRYVCTEPGHEQAGMTGTLDVG